MKVTALAIGTCIYYTRSPFELKTVGENVETFNLNSARKQKTELRLDLELRGAP